MGKRNRMWFGVGLAMIGLAPVLALGTAIARIERRTGLLRHWAFPASLVLFVRWLYRLPDGHDRLNEGAPAGRVSRANPRNGVFLEVDRVDDLKLIEGIGPAIENLLQEKGIRTFSQLAAAELGMLKSWLRDAGIGGINNPSTWPGQALLAAEGRFNELETYQQTLKTGRES